ncbi:hypothetical protein NHX12_026607, partial [Muraenolepis orangiensis]
PFITPPTVRIIHSGHACNVEEERHAERVYTIREGETLELSCLVTGHPRPQIFTEGYPRLPSGLTLTQALDRVQPGTGLLLGRGKDSEETEKRRKDSEETEKRRKDSEETEKRRKDSEEMEKRRNDSEEMEKRRNDSEEMEKRRNDSEDKERRTLIRWTKTAGSVSDRFQDSSVFNETLHITKILRTQGGRYYCKAENGLGSPAIKSIRVDVY